MATGIAVTATARLSPAAALPSTGVAASLTTPSSTFDSASPKAWIHSTLTANAAPRICTGTQPISAALSGPVLRNSSISAMKTTMKMPGSQPIRVIRTMNGLLASKPIPLRRKKPPGERACMRSPSRPPSSVPQMPASTVTPPKIVPAWPELMPWTRSR